jgi:hypothetical protein
MLSVRVVASRATLLGRYSCALLWAREEWPAPNDLHLFCTHCGMPERVGILTYLLGMLYFLDCKL